MKPYLAFIALSAVAFGGNPPDPVDDFLSHITPLWVEPKIPDVPDPGPPPEFDSSPLFPVYTTQHSAPAYPAPTPAPAYIIPIGGGSYYITH
jgi:hypothetical protein